MDFEVTPDDIDSREKHDAFLTLFGEEAHEQLTSEAEEGGDELPEDAVTREQWEQMSGTEQRAHLDAGGSVVSA